MNWNVVTIYTVYNNTKIKHNWVKQSPMFELMQLTWNISDEYKKKSKEMKRRRENMYLNNEPAF